MQKIALGTDHAGYALKEAIKAHLHQAGYAIVDFGTDSEQAVDYPDYCRPAAESAARGDCNLAKCNVLPLSRRCLGTREQQSRRKVSTTAPQLTL